MIKAKKLFVLLALLAITGFLSIWIYHFRPLIPTKAWEAFLLNKSGEEEHSTVPIKCYTLLGRPNIIFIRNPSAGKTLHRWFAINADTNSVCIPMGPDRRPYLAYNHDMALGIQLGNGKLEEPWDVLWTDNQVAFETTDLKITASKISEN
jgi:hypothetical protein